MSELKITPVVSAYRAIRQLRRRITELEGQLKTSELCKEAYIEKHDHLVDQLDAVRKDFINYRKGVIKIRGNDSMDHALCLNLSLKPLGEE